MPQQPLNVPRLRVLHELARRGSVTATADALWITPSAVSQQLAALERETGVALVRRAGRGVVLTVAGRTLAEHARRVLVALDAAGAALDAVATEPAGRLRVAAFPSVVRELLAPAIARLRTGSPDLVVELEDLEGALALDAVQTGHLDVAIVDDWSWDVAIERRGVRLVELAHDPLVAVLPPGHRRAGDGELPWEALAGEPFVTEGRGSLFAQAVATECRRRGFEPRVVARVHDLAAQLALVEAAGDVAVLPRLATAGTTLPVLDLVPSRHRRLLLVTRDQAEPLPAIEALERELGVEVARRHSR